MIRILITLSISMSWIPIFGQETQSIKGLIVDRDNEMPLIGATIQLLTDDNNIGSTTDIDGQFELENVVVGRHSIRISYIGYEGVTMPNILVTSGKEVYLEISMQESLINLKEVVVSAAVDKDKTINEMASVSARTFSLEEVTRYSGGRNDVSRLVANFAGVATSNDSRNDIVVRGNSPAGVLWRMEGVPIPNPNHFSTLGTTGGPVSALNTNLLKNSDFLTSAFPSEYGNAIGGVFDVGLRSGNKDKFEFTGQLAAFSGLEAMAEGPIGQGGNNSFLISYRYSFAQLASTFGLNIGTNATPNYQDLSFHIDIGSGKWGKFNVFGIGGISDIEFLAEETDENDLFAASDADSRAESMFGVFGIKHSIITSDKSYLKTTVSVSGNGNKYNEFRFRDSTLTNSYAFTAVDDAIRRYAIHSFYNTKYSAKFTSRIGVTYDWQNVISSVKDREGNLDLDGDDLPDFAQIRDVDGNIATIQPYFSLKYRPVEKLTIIGGLHGQIQTLNTKTAVEPRVGLEYVVTSKSALSIGYGLHSQVQPLPVFFILSPDAMGNFTSSNADLDFTRSHHFVAGWDYKLASSWRIKSEVYYQSIFDAPIEQTSSSFSLLNAGADFVFPQNGNLVNEGTGVNYGFELTVEKFFSKGYYGLLTGSLFDSSYKGSDGVRRNTAFNNEYVLNLLGGKEWKLNSKISVTTDFKVTNAGGRYITPVNLEASKLIGTEVRFEELAFSEKLDPYFRFDFKIGFRINNKGWSQQLSLDFQNVTNNKNVFTKRYNRQTNEVNTIYQIGFFPDVLWRIQF